jgi:hypothetical protein
MRWVAWFLLFLSGAVLLVSCASMGTPMHGTCRHMPTVEACQAAADKYITDDCLRNCVRHLCVEGTAKCGAEEEIPGYCALRQRADGVTGGYVPKPKQVGEENDPPRTCTLPRKKMDWCELDISPTCASQMMVHELSHACGWPEYGGKGVPGGIDGRYQCDDFNPWGFP